MNFLLWPFGPLPFDFLRPSSHMEISLMAMSVFLSCSESAVWLYWFWTSRWLHVWYLFIGFIVQMLHTSKKVLNRHHVDPSLVREWSLDIYVSQIIPLSQDTHSWSPTSVHVVHVGEEGKGEELWISLILKASTVYVTVYTATIAPPTHTHTHTHFLPPPIQCTHLSPPSLIPNTHTHLTILPLQNPFTLTHTPEWCSWEGDIGKKYTISANPFEVCYGGSWFPF